MSEDKSMNSLIQTAIAAAGSLKRPAAERPWLFDFTRKTPITGYQK